MCNGVNRVLTTNLGGCLATFSRVVHTQCLEQRRSRKWGNSYVCCLVISCRQWGAPSRTRRGHRQKAWPHLQTRQQPCLFWLIYLLWLFPAGSRDTKPRADLFFCLQINNNRFESRHRGTKATVGSFTTQQLMHKKPMQQNIYRLNHRNESKVTR